MEGTVHGSRLLAWSEHVLESLGPSRSITGARLVVGNLVRVGRSGKATAGSTPKPLVCWLLS